VFVIVPLIALLAYIALGYLLVRIVVGPKKTWTLPLMFVVVIVPFAIDENYKRRLVSDFSPNCETLVSSPVGVDAVSSNLVQRTIISSPLLAEAGEEQLNSGGPDGQLLAGEFLSAFYEDYGTGDLSLVSTKNITRSELCGSDGDEHKCGLRALSERPTVNILTTSPSSLRFNSSHAVRYWVWGDAIGSGDEVHYWTRLIKRRGSIKEGGWAYWWPWPGSHKLVECTTNDLALKDWLIDR